MRYLITVDKDGKVTVTVQGVVGPSCKGKSLELAQLLGGKVEETARTNDYYATVAATTQTTVGRQ